MIGLDVQVQLGAFYAKTVMDRHHVPSNQRSKLVSQVTGLQYGAAHRRTRGDLPWTFDELSRLALHFDENLEQVFFYASLLGATPGEFVVGGFRHNCRFWRGKHLSANTPCDTFAAKLIKSTWIVSPFGDHPPGDDVYEAKNPLLEHTPDLTYRVAVLDETPAAAAAVQAKVIAAKMRCKVFDSVETLKASIELHPFDVYVMDWLIDGQDVIELIAHIRELDSKTLIFLFTNRGSSNDGLSQKIGETAAIYDIRYFSKTFDISVMISMLHAILDARSKAASSLSVAGTFDLGC